MFRPKNLGIAFGLGVAAEVVLYAFGLQASLALASFSTGRLYWAIIGVYLVSGFAVALAIVPWHRLSIRVTSGLFILLIGCLVGAVRAT